jgi:hypothetical protein
MTAEKSDLTNGGRNARHCDNHRTGESDASESQSTRHSGAGSDSDARAEPRALTGTDAASESELESHDLTAS